MKRLLFLPLSGLFFLAACSAGGTEKVGNESINQSDSLALIEQEILAADTLRLDSLRRDSLIKAEKDSLDSTLQDTLPASGK